MSETMTAKHYQTLVIEYVGDRFQPPWTAFSQQAMGCDVVASSLSHGLHENHELQEINDELRTTLVTLLEFVGTTLAQELQDLIDEAKEAGCENPLPSVQAILCEWEERHTAAHHKLNKLQKVGE